MSITPTQARSSAGADYKETHPGGFFDAFREENSTPFLGGYSSACRPKPKIVLPPAEVALPGF